MDDNKASDGTVAGFIEHGYWEKRDGKDVFVVTGLRLTSVSAMPPSSSATPKAIGS